MRLESSRHCACRRASSAAFPSELCLNAWSNSSIAGIRGADPSFCGGVGEICGAGLSCVLVELETAACAKADAATIIGIEAAIRKNLAIMLGKSRSLHAINIGATGFEPATCRRGDRSTQMY